jgi:hypothetical protein
MTHRPRLPTPIAGLAASLLLAATAVHADVLAGDHDLVILGVPAAPATSADDVAVDVTLTWTVREIFAGEPGGVTVAVRHPALTPEQVRSLGSGERWILLAHRDRDRPGRWTAPMPLRATPAAVEAFRRWSAPPDVRPERHVSEVVAEVRQDERRAAPAEPVPTAPTRAPAVEPAASAPVGVELGSGEATPPEAEGPIVTDEAARAEPVVAAPVPAAPAAIEDVPVAEESVARRAEPAPPPARPALTPAPPAESPGETRVDPSPPVQATPGAGWSAAGVAWPALLPPEGVALPPPPPPVPIGPEPARRSDLKKPRGSRDGDA